MKTLITKLGRLPKMSTPIQTIAGVKYTAKRFDFETEAEGLNLLTILEGEHGKLAFYRLGEDPYGFRLGLPEKV